MDIVTYDGSENITLEEFKQIVKKWLEYDKFMKKAKEAIREKKVHKEKLGEIITKFMIKYNIEDLNTKEGKIRCKTTNVKTPISHKCIKQKIVEYFQNDTDKQTDIMTKVYENDRPLVEKLSLRRLRIT